MNAFILETISKAGYLGVFFLMALENVFPPIPSEIILGYGGVLVAQGRFEFWTLLVVGTLGTVAGNVPWYYLGSRWKEEQLRAFLDRYGRWLTLDWDEFERSRALFRRHGEWVVFLFRFSPLLRTIVSLPAGLAHMKFWRFLLFTFLGSLIWNGALIWGGQKLAGLIAQYEKLAGYAVIGIIVLGIGYYIYRVVTWRKPGAR